MGSGGVHLGPAVTRTHDGRFRAVRAPVSWSGGGRAGRGLGCGNGAGGPCDWRRARSMRVLAALSWRGTGWVQTVRGMVMLLPARAAASSGATPATQRDRAAWRRSQGRRASGVAARRGPSAAVRAVCQARPQVLSLRIPPRAPVNSRPSGAVPKARRWSSRRRTRRAGMRMALVAPSVRCLRPRCSWLAPVVVRAVAMRGAAVSMISSRPGAGRR